MTTEQQLRARAKILATQRRWKQTGFKLKATCQEKRVAVVGITAIGHQYPCACRNFCMDVSGDDTSNIQAELVELLFLRSVIIVFPQLRPSSRINNLE